MQSALLLPAASLVPHSTRPVWYEWGTRSSSDASADGNKKSARRRLFQQEDAAEEETNQQFVQRLLVELAERYNQKWGFDFDAGRPLETEADARFVYEAVPAESVPGFYRASEYARAKDGADASPPLLNTSDAENRCDMYAVLEDAETMEVSVSGNNDVSSASPGRVLRKARRSVQTPKRRHSARVDCSGGGSQTRLTEFLPARKHLSATRTIIFKQQAEDVQQLQSSPKRACMQSSKKSPVGSRRRARRDAVAALFK